MKKYKKANRSFDMIVRLLNDNGVKLESEKWDEIYNELKSKPFLSPWLIIHRELKGKKIKLI